ncbi:MAG: TlpA family protein disulfide reductase [Chthoniobacter sp.]|nr:TlpA family protein disulfide reductase [Chthoniobacter sp.]
MKTYLFIPALLLTLTFPALAADEKGPATGEKPAEQPKAKAEDFSKYKTADALWKRIEELKEEPKERPKSQAEMLTMVKAWFGKQQAAGEAFGKAYPEDVRHYAAKLVVLQAKMQLARLPGGESVAKADPDAIRKEVEAITAAADAPEEVKGEAAFLRTMLSADDMDQGKPESVAKFFQATDEFLAQYGTHKLAKQMREVQLEVASQAKTPEAEALLKKIADGKEPELALAAKEILGQREKMASLKTKPLELTFTAADGAEVDLANLRGKVVLVDFWASWCGPCIGEMPNVVATYNKLHEKGFEIVGISLDQDKGKMEAAMKKHGMTWAQYFDGKGWQNKISSGFGIESIPAAWLLDKKGVLRETELRGPALAAGVEKLLAE